MAKKKDWTEVKYVVRALLPLGYGRPTMLNLLRQAGYEIGESTLEALISEAKRDYRKHTLSMVLSSELIEKMGLKAPK